MTITLTNEEVREAVAFYLSQKMNFRNMIVNYDSVNHTYNIVTYNNSENNEYQFDVRAQALLAKFDLSAVNKDGYHTNYIPAIKWVRENYGLGLKEAKDFVDRFRTW